MVKRLALLASVPIALASISSLSAQVTAPQPEPVFQPFSTVSGSASSDVKLTPDRATLRISVQTRAASATSAAAENATKQTSVMKTLRALGIAENQISTADYNVNPEYRYENNKPPILTGYTVTNTVLVDVHDVSQLGKILDAVLSSGANMISSLDFYSSSTEAARSQGITAAVIKARAEAEVAARAAGGSLGPLVSLDIGGGVRVPPPRPVMGMMTMSAKAVDSTPISPGEQTVTVSVSASWRFVPTR